VNRNWLRTVAVVVIPAGAAVSAAALLDGPAGAALAVVAAGSVVTLALFMADRVALSALRARPVGEVEYPHLYRAVRELSQAARLPVPRIYVSPALPPNSFAIGRSRRTMKVCCTEGLLRLLTADELRAVLAHELAHVREHDTVATSFCAGLAAVITSLASPAWLPGSASRGRGASGSVDRGPATRGPALAGARLGFLGHPGSGLASVPTVTSGRLATPVASATSPDPAEPSPPGALSTVTSTPPAPPAPEPERPGLAATVAMLVVGPPAALLLQLTLSRGREYRADAVAAALTGEPLALAQALRKIEARTVELPLSLTGPLASASPLMFVNPFSCAGLTRLFSTHPPTRERVFRLEGLAGYPR
jgi:Zn-dependent protease with chaperone function